MTKPNTLDAFDRDIVQGLLESLTDPVFGADWHIDVDGHDFYVKIEDSSEGPIVVVTGTDENDAPEVRRYKIVRA